VIISFNHLVDAGKQRWRNGEAQCFGGLEVDGQFERRRLLNWKIDRLGISENFVDVTDGAPIQIAQVRPVVNEGAGSGRSVRMRP